MQSDRIDCAKAMLLKFKDMVDDFCVDDNDCLNIIAYCVEQSIELSLKAILEVQGIDCQNTGHSINRLCNLVTDYAPDVLSSDSCEFLKSNALTLTSWGSIGCCATDFTIPINVLKDFVNEASVVYESAEKFVKE